MMPRFTTAFNKGLMFKSNEVDTTKKEDQEEHSAVALIRQLHQCHQDPP